jgi:hypothetical protein
VKVKRPEQQHRLRIMKAGTKARAMRVRRWGWIFGIGNVKREKNYSECWLKPV